MKQFIISILLTVAALAGVQAQDIPPRPDPPKLVNDLANQLNPNERAMLEQKLVAYNDSTSSQIVVVTVPTLGDYPIADYAFKLGTTWGVGQKGKNNGIVLLWAPNERKVFIATGYGLEGAIPDAIAKRIVSQVITPQFKAGQFYQGLSDGVDTIFKYATGEYKADPKEDNGDGKGFSPLLIVLVVFVVILIIMFRNRGGGGGNRGYRDSGIPPIFFPYTTHSGRGSSSGNWGGGFGGGDGGGFGGFGGGSFGGGGAGGDY
ncbi:TPM domain-containing protein [Dyadobacter sp. CY261]|uniref:TPM domain-containing protein n=1 Tax=Dyadobacter sp. CY261 TaxID=2907203 RepID=UPI001F23BA38|nr:TPM domain-containing protein [Dyadobacter sp. CY261]MCF0072067.1 TPM domain-containing protein [Dyadobacter sp. CY261]